MTNASKQKAHDLAVAYAAYCSSMKGDDNYDISFWSQELINAQKASGVEMVKPEILNRNVRLFA
jgi:hypothetical protein